MGEDERKARSTESWVLVIALFPAHLDWVISTSSPWPSILGLACCKGNGQDVWSLAVQTKSQWFHTSVLLAHIRSLLGLVLLRDGSPVQSASILWHLFILCRSIITGCCGREKSLTNWALPLKCSCLPVTPAPATHISLAKWIQVCLQNTLSFGCVRNISHTMEPNQSFSWMSEDVCMHVFMCFVTESCPTLSRPVNYSPPGSSVQRIFLEKNTGADCHFLFQGIFPTQGWNPSLLSPSPAGGFFTPVVSREARVCVHECTYVYKHTNIYTHVQKYTHIYVSEYFAQRRK